MPSYHYNSNKKHWNFIYYSGQKIRGNSLSCLDYRTLTVLRSLEKKQRFWYIKALNSTGVRFVTFCM